MELIVNIKKKFPDFNLDIDFKCDNSIWGLLGESGSGKSMTLRCIAGLTKPDEGKIVLNGRTLFDSELNINLPIKERKIGFLFQNYALFPHMTVEMNIGYALSNLSRHKRNGIVDEMLNMMQIEDLKNRYPHQISGGQQQRVALARALAVNPEALLLDEPFSALDNHLRNIMLKQMTDILSTYQSPTLFVTHNLDEAYQLCENLLIISRGIKSAEGNKNNIFRTPPSLEAAKITGCKNISTVKTITPGIIEALDWGCKIKLSTDIDRELTHVGIRAHYIQMAVNEDYNTYNCWPVYTSETPFRKYIYLKMNEKPLGRSDFHLIWDVSSEEWDTIINMPLPWRIYLNEEKMVYINE